MDKQETFLEPTITTLSWTMEERGGFQQKRKRREGEILKVWEMVYFHINQLQDHDKKLICAANGSSLIKVHTKYLTLEVYTK